VANTSEQPLAFSSSGQSHQHGPGAVNRRESSRSRSIPRSGQAEGENTTQNLHGYGNVRVNESQGALASQIDGVQRQPLQNAQDVGQMALPQQIRQRGGSRNTGQNQQLSTIMSRSLEGMSSYNAAQNSCEDLNPPDLDQTEEIAEKNGEIAGAQQQEKQIQLRPVHQPINSESFHSSLNMEMQFDRRHHHLSTASHRNIQSDSSINRQDRVPSSHHCPPI